MKPTITTSTTPDQAAEHIRARFDSKVSEGNDGYIHLKIRGLAITYNLQLEALMSEAPYLDPSSFSVKITELNNVHRTMMALADKLQKAPRTHWICTKCSASVPEIIPQCSACGHSIKMKAR